MSSMRGISLKDVLKKNVSQNFMVVFIETSIASQRFKSLTLTPKGTYKELFLKKKTALLSIYKLKHQKDI